MKDLLDTLWNIILVIAGIFAFIKLMYVAITFFTGV